MMRAERRKHRHQALLTLGFLAALSTLVRGQGEVTPERVAALERMLSEERTRNQEQAQRLQELELTLATVLDAQSQGEAETLGREIETLVDAAVARRVALAPTTTPSPFRVSGFARFSFRSFGGQTISTDESVEIEHLLVRLEYRPHEDLLFRVTPASSHVGEVWVVEAMAELKVTSWLDLTLGRFIAPFNGYHAWAFPSDSFVEPYAGLNAPKPFLYAPWWDEGAMLSGSVPFGGDGEHRFDWAAWVVNGLNAQGLDGVHKTSFGDNNENKTFGGRISTTLRLSDAVSLTIGAGGLFGKWDSEDRLDAWAVTTDIELRVGRFGLYLDGFYRANEISGTVAENPTFEFVTDARLSGLKAKVWYRVFDNLELYAYADQLNVRQPPRPGGQFSVFDLGDENFAIRTYVVGAKIDVMAHVRLILEAGFFDKDADLGKDIPFLAASVLISF